MRKLLELTRHPFFQGSVIFTVASTLSNLLTLVANRMFAAGVSVSEYGEYFAALTYFIALSVPLTAITMIVVRRLGSIPEKKRRQFGAALEATFIQFCRSHIIHLSMGALLLGAFLWWQANILLISILFILGMILFGVFFQLYQSLMLGYKDFFRAGILITIVAVFKLFTGITVVFIFPELWVVFAGVVIAEIVAVIYGRRYIAEYTGEPLQLSLLRVRSLLLQRRIIIPILSMIGITAIASVDVMIVKKYFEPHDAGLYSAVSLLGRIIFYVSAPVSAVAYTFFTSKENIHQSKQILFVAAGGFTLIGLASVFLYTFFPQLVIMIFFNSQYSDIQQLLLMAAVFGSLSALISLFSQYLLSLNHTIALVSLPVVLVQVLMLRQYHDSLLQVLWVNIAASICLLFLYVFATLAASKQKAEL